MKPAAQTWVVDSSPLILLAKIGFLSLVPDMTPRLIIPSDVLDEIKDAPADDPARQLVGEIVRAGRAVVGTLHIPPALTARRLGRGETAVLAVALQTQGEGSGAIAVLDDHDARRAAKALGIPTLGTVGILIRAKDDGRIPALRSYLHQLQAAGMWGSEAFYQQAALSVGETWP